MQISLWDLPRFFSEDCGMPTALTPVACRPSQREKRSYTKQNALNKEESLNYGASKCGSPALASLSHTPALAPPSHAHTCSVHPGNALKS